MDKTEREIIREICKRLNKPLYMDDPRCIEMSNGNCGSSIIFHFDKDGKVSNIFS